MVWFHFLLKTGFQNYFNFLDFSWRFIFLWFSKFSSGAKFEFNSHNIFYFTWELDFKTVSTFQNLDFKGEKKTEELNRIGKVKSKRVFHRQGSKWGACHASKSNSQRSRIARSSDENRGNKKPSPTDFDEQLYTLNNWLKVYYLKRVEEKSGQSACTPRDWKNTTGKKGGALNAIIETRQPMRNKLADNLNQ
jgi:hypothetical protein